MNDLADLQLRLGVNFRDSSLLVRALVHGSYLNETSLPGVASNERLEFLGDAVLDLTVAVWLYHEFPDAAEGELTRRSDRLVRGSTLARAAAGIGLGDYLKMSRGERAGGGRRKLRNLAGAFEAVLAALYLDQGLDACAELVTRLIAPLVDATNTADAKTRLQEYLQARGCGLPKYQVTVAGGKPHETLFNAVVNTGKTVIGRGHGSSKQAAETAAAAAALASLGQIDG